MKIFTDVFTQKILFDGLSDRIKPVSKSQTPYQQGLVETFIIQQAGGIIAAFAHPTCKNYSKIVYAISDKLYIVEIGYGYGEAENFRYWSCNYTLNFSSSGELLSVVPYEKDASGVWGCKGPNLRCFHLCDITKSLVSEFSFDEKVKAEKLLKKALDEFSCVDFCFARLWLLWNSSYKSRY